MHAAEASAVEVGLPLVLKPDVGQRGRGVFIARQAADVRDYLRCFPGAVIAQRHIGGEEYGVFIARGPDDSAVQVLSIMAGMMLLQELLGPVVTQRALMAAHETHVTKE